MAIVGAAVIVKEPVAELVMVIVLIVAALLLVPPPIKLPPVTASVTVVVELVPVRPTAWVTPLAVTFRVAVCVRCGLPCGSARAPGRAQSAHSIPKSGTTTQPFGSQ